MPTLWEQDRLPQYPALRENLHADVAVIGGGIAGILTAYYLQKSGLRVVLLEEDRLAGGVTARTTARVSAQHGLFCADLVRHFGTFLARQYVQANLLAVQQYRELIARERIDCDFCERTSCVYAPPGSDAPEEEAACAASLGAPIRLGGAEEPLPFPIGTALYWEKQATLSPLRFLAALLPGLTVYEHSPVRDVRGHRVLCDGGSVTAEHIVITTRFPMLERYGFYRLKLRQESSFFLALTGAPQPRTLYTDAQEGWMLQSCGPYLLLGGGRCRCGTGSGSYERLRRQAQLWFPQAREAFVWSSQDCSTLDGVPYIGAYSAATPYWHVATGFGQWGMTNSMAAAQILTGDLLGRPLPYAEVFSPVRFFPSASLESMMEGALYAVRGAGQRLFTGAERAASAITPGHAKVVRYHGRLYGLYRHTDGGLYAVSPVCPHRGCMLQWNDEEKTWDCPCHGSRFSYTGHRLMHPAKAALKSYDLSETKEI